VNNKLDFFLEGNGRGLFEVLLWYLLEGPRKTVINLGRDKWFPDQDSNQALQLHQTVRQISCKVYVGSVNLLRVLHRVLCRVPRT
jgi:hypothetical protein